MRKKLGELPIGATFIVPGDTDTLPIENSGVGKHFLYKVSSRKNGGMTRVYNKDLRIYAYCSNEKEIEEL